MYRGEDGEKNTKSHGDISLPMAGLSKSKNQDGEYFFPSLSIIILPEYL